MFVCGWKKSLPLMVLLLVIAQIDLVCAVGRPTILLSLLHLTPVTDDLSRGVCVGLGVSIDFLLAFQLARSLVKRSMHSRA